ncbi:RNA-directed DNA polymerase [Alteromonas sp. CYL-A6]|uniref:RNA-directed DNA polymerase n=1 Tax=Alteromonas nitratireducens TaxID=3390813 RepID=UPI0034AE6EB9
MFNLTEQELENAFSAINHHGYSAMLPEPFEWKAVKNKWAEVRDFIKSIDLDTYDPKKPMKIFAPKNRANIRVVHLLHPQDLIIYTALTLIVKNDIEDNRISKRAKRVFSYRVDKARDDRLYDSRGAHDDYIEQVERKVDRDNIRFVGIADIADFYPSIYQHRLENAIQAIASDQRGIDVARVLVKKLISNLMGRNSYGIPVGPYASKVLAEALLIDVDAYLHSNAIDFVRWVDDYSIFCKSEYEAQATLFSLGEWLYDHHGLTLQSAKTKILPKQRFNDEILSKPEENLTDRDHVISLLRDIRMTGYEDEWDDEEEEIDEDEIEQTLQQLQAVDLVEMLQESMSDAALVDYEVINYVLTRLPRMPEAEDGIKEQVLDLVIENAELLYPSSENVAKYIVSFNDLPKKEKKKIAKKLLKPLNSKRNPPPDYYAMWMLYIFTTSEDWNQIKDIIKLYQTTSSDVVKRYAALAIAKGGSRAEALIIKDDLNSAPPMLKLAILEASNKLGTDERKHWKLANQINDKVEKII